MPSLNDYLKKLLYQYDCVVVPELGAFLTHYQPASFTEATRQYLPPRKRVAFNEALRLDDGILINYIMLHESVTRDVAQRQISQFVSGMRQQVSAQGRFDLDSIGAFSQNDEGRLQFEPSLRHNFFDEAYGMSAITATALDRQLAAEPVLNAVPVTALGPVLVRDEDVTYLPVHRSGQQRYSTGWRVAAAVLLVGSLGLVSYFSVLDPGRPFQSGIDPANMLRLPESWRNGGSPDAASAVVKKSTPASEPVENPVLTTATPVSEPAAAVTPTAVVVPTPAANRPTVTPVPDAVATPVAVKKSAPAPVAKHNVSGPFFTVIAGSFANKANAFKLRRQLQKAGYGDAFIILPATKKQLYKVAASGSISADEATANADTISALVGAKAWVMRN